MVRLRFATLTMNGDKAGKAIAQLAAMLLLIDTASEVKTPRFRFGLRARLALAFALVALGPLLVVVPFARAELRRSAGAAFDAERSSGQTAIRSTLAQTSEEVTARLSALARAPAAEQLVRDWRNGDLGAAARAAPALAQAQGLGVLSVLTADGHTLGSAQLPARVGDPDPSMLALTRSTSPQLVRVQVQGEHRVETALALVTAQTIEGSPIWLVGGLRVDGDFAARLARAGGAQVRILGGEEPVLGGSVEPPVAIDTMPLGEATFELGFSRAAQERTERRLRTAVASVSGLAALAALLLGIWAARRITRPVEALTIGARQLAAGALGTQVQVRASAEVGELVEAFNRMGQDLQATTQRLVTAERVAAWQDIARGLAHELKNPLTPIQMSLETLLAAQKSSSPAFTRLFPEAAGAMLEEVERLRRTIDAFSRFARLPKPKRAPLEIGEWLQGVLAVHGERPGLRVEARIQGPLWVDADRDQLTQVVVNLLQNAAEALEGQGRVEVRAESAGDRVVLTVEDDGPGIPAEQRERIFEPYFTTKEKGTGLGLAISSRIVAEHGGQLGVEPVTPHGARFRITLPRTRASA
jgi:two-component system nitrogen regulation sensor histidine kinase NtrY